MALQTFYNKSVGLIVNCLSYLACVDFRLIILKCALPSYVSSSFLKKKSRMHSLCTADYFCCRRGLKLESVYMELRST